MLCNVVSFREKIVSAKFMRKYIHVAKALKVCLPTVSSLPSFLSSHLSMFCCGRSVWWAFWFSAVLDLCGWLLLICAPVHYQSVWLAFVDLCSCALPVCVIGWCWSVLLCITSLCDWLVLICAPVHYQSVWLAGVALCSCALPVCVVGWCWSVLLCIASLCDWLVLICAPVHCQSVWLAGVDLCSCALPVCVIGWCWSVLLCITSLCDWLVLICAPVHYQSVWLAGVDLCYCAIPVCVIGWCWSVLLCNTSLYDSVGLYSLVCSACVQPVLTREASDLIATEYSKLRVQENTDNDKAKVSF